MIATCRMKLGQMKYYTYPIPYTHVCLYYHSIEHNMSMEYGVWTMGRRSDSGGIFRRQQNDVLFTGVIQLEIDLLRV